MLENPDVEAPDSPEAAPERLADRLRLAMGSESVNAFAKRSGLGESLLRSYLAGSAPGLDKAARIAKAAGVSLEWLATGKGPRDRDMVSVMDPERGGMVEYRSRDDMEGFVVLPRYEVRASAGAGTVVHSERIVDYLSFKAEWILHRLRLNPEHLILIEAVGDSMRPRINNGDLLLVNTQVSSVRGDAIYAISVAGELLVKRIQREMNGDLVIISDNTAYAPKLVRTSELDRVHVVGEVVWHAGQI
jgi:phage repressor protein C with HTH and peptisase S24 domain